MILSKFFHTLSKYIAASVHVPDFFVMLTAFKGLQMFRNAFGQQFMGIICDLQPQIIIKMLECIP